MLTAQDAVKNEKEQLFREIRHIVGTQHRCPEHLTLDELYSILVLLKVDHV